MHGHNREDGAMFIGHYGPGFVAKRLRESLKNSSKASSLQDAPKCRRPLAGVGAFS
jgi:hypothetical protein